MTDNSGWFLLEKNSKLSEDETLSGQSTEKKDQTVPPPFQVRTQSMRNMPTRPTFPVAPKRVANHPSSDATDSQVSSFKAQGTPHLSAPTKQMNSQTIGTNGPILLQDTILNETLNDFVYSAASPRALFTKGFGAMGYFETKRSMKQYTLAKLFQTPGQRVKAVTRFSLAISSEDTPDTLRNLRGFATKFYSDSGVYDLICHHLPILPIRDPIHLPELARLCKASPKTMRKDTNAFWDFIIRHPESVHYILHLYGTSGTIRNFQHMPGTSHTYRWVNADGLRHLVKYHWKPLSGIKFIDTKTAHQLAQQNVSISGQELFDHLHRRKTVEYELQVQVIPMSKWDRYAFNPLDSTKLWPKEDVPFMSVGKLVLNENPESHFEQIEKLAFSPANLLNGIELSEDRILQGLTSICWTAQRHRLGANFRSIPINRQSDWSCEYAISSGNGLKREGDILRADLPDVSPYQQAQNYYSNCSEPEKAELTQNLVCEMRTLTHSICDRAVMLFSKVDPDLAQTIRSLLEV